MNVSKSDIVSPAGSTAPGEVGADAKRGWQGRAAVRASLTAALGLRLALSGIALLLVIGLNGPYTQVMRLMNLTGSSRGIWMVPAPVHGLAEYITGPWLRWDSNIYVSIAARGYSFNLSTAFLPLYPLLIRVVSFFLGGHLTASALLISTTAAVVMFAQLYRLVIRLTGSAHQAAVSIAVASLLPIAFYFVAPYTESLFLALSLSAILATLDRHWTQAMLFGILASLTRQQGVLLGLLALPDIWRGLRQGWSSGQGLAQRVKQAFRMTWRPAMLPIAAVGAYAAWIAVILIVVRSAPPWQLLTSPHGWNQHFTVPGYGVLVDVLTMIAAPSIVFLQFYSIPLDTAAALLAAAGLVVAWRRLPAGLLLYLIACWCVAVFKVESLGITNSAARYMLALLPLCLVPAGWLGRARPAARVLFFAVSALLLCFYFTVWVFWAWVN